MTDSHIYIFIGLLLSIIVFILITLAIPLQTDLENENQEAIDQKFLLMKFNIFLMDEKSSVIEDQKKKNDLFSEHKAETSHCYSDHVSWRWEAYLALQASLGGKNLEGFCKAQGPPSNWY